MDSLSHVSKNESARLAVGAAGPGVRGLPGACGGLRLASGERASRPFTFRKDPPPVLACWRCSGGSALRAFPEASRVTRPRGHRGRSHVVLAQDALDSAFPEFSLSCWPLTLQVRLSSGALPTCWGAVSSGKPPCAPRGGFEPRPRGLWLSSQGDAPTGHDSREGGHVPWLRRLCLAQGAGRSACGLADGTSAGVNKGIALTPSWTRAFQVCSSFLMNLQRDNAPHVSRVRARGAAPPGSATRASAARPRARALPVAGAFQRGRLHRHRAFRLAHCPTPGTQ